MPTQKDLKRRVRARMEKTGESYTIARARLLEKKAPRRRPSAAKEPARDLGALAGMSDASVKAKTGRSWKQWVSVLDRAGAAARPHREIAALLAGEHGLGSWWSQMVTVGYERIRGLREKSQQRGGGYMVHKSKVFAASVPDLWEVFLRCREWAPGAPLRMSTASRHKTMRMRWGDGSLVVAQFLAKTASRSQLALQHGPVGTREEATRLRAFWSERLAALAVLLGSR